MMSPRYLLWTAMALMACGGSTGGGSMATDATTSDDASADAQADVWSPPAGDAVDDGVETTDATPGDQSITPEDGGAVSDVVYGVPCELGDRIGEFQVAHESFYAQVSGEVAAGVIPLTVLQEVASEGDCRLMRKENPFCEVPCGAGELCDHDGSCVPYPENQSVGVVTVSGLVEGDVVMEPKSATYFDTSVSMPLFDAGAMVQLKATGDDLPAFELEAYGVPDLVLPEGVLTMSEGEPLPISWDAEPGAWRLYFSLNIDQHGSSPGTLFCDVEDTGSFQVPSSFVDELLGMGVSGFATAHFYRRTVDSTSVPLNDEDSGCVQLTVSSYVYGKLDVEGHTACQVDPDCPQGEVCDVLINTCVKEDGS